MSILRQKMIEDMQLRGLAERTQESYVLVVRQLAAYYRRSPDEIGEQELRQYFLYLKNEKKVSRSTSTLALCGIKFFYERTLGREWTVFEHIRPPKEEKLPVVLSLGEVGRILKCVRREHHRACLGLIYACGLRLLEGVRMPVTGIDGERKQVQCARWQRQQRSLCASARSDPQDVTATLADPSQPGMAVSSQKEWPERKSG